MKLTREGKRFLLATVLLTFAAFNTGNNLIYLVLALMFSVIAIFVVGLFMNMRGLSLRVSLRGPVFAGQEAELEVSVANSKRFLPSYSLRLIMPEGVKGGGLVVRVAPSSTEAIACTASFEKRGIYRWGDFRLESGFPFIFLTKRISVSVEGTVTVYPELIDVEGVRAYSGEGQSMYTIRPGRGEELLTIREFRGGDDVKLVSWKATARAQTLMVREFTEELPTAVNIVLDDQPPFDAVAFEKAVSYSASLVLKMLDEGYYVGLVTSTKLIPWGTGPEQLYRILDVLAVAKETDEVLNIYEADPSGTSIMVLKSGASRIRGGQADAVVYAT